MIQIKGGLRPIFTFFSTILVLTHVSAAFALDDDELIGIVDYASGECKGHYFNQAHNNGQGLQFDFDLISEPTNPINFSHYLACFSGSSTGFLFAKNPIPGTLPGSRVSGVCTASTFNGTSDVSTATRITPYADSCVATETIQLVKGSTRYTATITINVESCTSSDPSYTFNTPCSVTWSDEVSFISPPIAPPTGGKSPTKVGGYFKANKFICTLKKSKKAVPKAVVKLQRQSQSLGDFEVIASAKTNAKGIATFTAEKLATLGIETGDSLRCSKGSTTSTEVGYVDPNES